MQIFKFHTDHPSTRFLFYLRGRTHDSEPKLQTPYPILSRQNIAHSLISPSTSTQNSPRNRYNPHHSFIHSFLHSFASPSAHSNFVCAVRLEKQSDWKSKHAGRYFRTRHTVSTPVHDDIHMTQFTHSLTHSAIHLQEDINDFRDYSIQFNR